MADNSHPVLSQILNIVSEEEFNPFPLFSKFCRRGYAPDAVAEAIYDGFIDAYVRWDKTESHKETFGYFCYLNCLGKLNGVQKKRKTELPLIEEYYDCLSVEDVYDTDSKCAELAGVDLHRVFTRFLFMSFKDNDYGNCFNVMYRRYVLHESWDIVAKSLGLNSKQAAQFHNAKGVKVLMEYANSKEGKRGLLALLREEGAKIDVLCEDDYSLGSTFFQEVLAE